jgi:crotonobetainyl-CoA:carnitine CoA-transferase CaiB-like acyl-CoA transferase
MSNTQNTSPMAHDLPLSGLVVVEVGDSAAAPFAGQVLAALGAEVLKVERPVTGDSSRSWGKKTCEGSAAAFHALNRGKKSLCLDIKDADDLACLHELIGERADIFLHNLRPGTPARYGLDPDSLRARKPSLICCEIGAYGHVGSMNTMPGYDPLLQAFAGIMSVTGEEGREPVRCGVSLIDFGTGMWAVIGILAALRRKSDSCSGATVNSSLLETAVSWMTMNIAALASEGDAGGRFGSGVAIVVPHRVYAVQDGYLAVSCANDGLFVKLCTELNKQEWARDLRFSTNSARLDNRREVDNLIEAELLRAPRAVWQRRLDLAGIPCAPVQTAAELVAHKQTRALKILQKPSESELELVGLPLSFDGVRPPPLASAPLLGQANSRAKSQMETSS